MTARKLMPAAMLLFVAACTGGGSNEPPPPTAPAKPDCDASICVHPAKYDCKGTHPLSVTIEMAPGRTAASYTAEVTSGDVSLGAAVDVLDSASPKRTEKIEAVKTAKIAITSDASHTFTRMFQRDRDCSQEG